MTFAGRPICTFLLFFLLLLTAGHRSAGQAGRDVPVREGYHEVNGARLYYKVMGRGEPVLVLHGGPTLDHSYLLPQLGELARRYQLIFFDQRQSGRSQILADSAAITYETFVADIEGIRRAFGLERMHLLGHSWGGLLAMTYAVEHPEHLNTLILLNSVAAGTELWQREEAELAKRVTPADSVARARILQSEAFRQDRPEAYAELFRLSFRHQFHDPARAADLTLTLPADIRARGERFGQTAQGLLNFDLHPRLHRIACPTLIVYGDAEPAATIAGPDLAAHIAGSRLEVIPRCGHFPFVEQPRAFRRAVLGFLKKAKK